MSAHGNNGTRQRRMDDCMYRVVQTVGLVGVAGLVAACIVITWPFSKATEFVTLLQVRLKLYGEGCGGACGYYMGTQLHLASPTARYPYGNVATSKVTHKSELSRTDIIKTCFPLYCWFIGSIFSFIAYKDKYIFEKWDVVQGQIVWILFFSYQAGVWLISQIRCL